jgi:hypothetical protein
MSSTSLKSGLSEFVIGIGATTDDGVHTIVERAHRQETIAAEPAPP